MEEKQKIETEQNSDLLTPNNIYSQPASSNNSPDNPMTLAATQTETTLMPANKPRLPRLVKIVSWIFWVPFVLLALIFAYLIYQSSHGVSGTEYIGIVLVPFVIAEAILGIFYLILLIVYVFSKYPSTPHRILSIAVILVLLGIFGWQIIGNTQEINKVNKSKKLLTDSEVLSLIDSCTAESVQKNGDKVDLLLVSSAYYDSKGKYLWRSTTGSSANWDKFVAEVKKVKSKCGGNVDAIDSSAAPKTSWASVQQATELLQQCKIKTFNYTQSAFDNSGIDEPSTGTPSGIILDEYPTFSHLYIESSQESTMVPVARGVQAQCDGPQFYHDNNYEQRQADGSWQ